MKRRTLNAERSFAGGEAVFVDGRGLGDVEFGGVDGWRRVFAGAGDAEVGGGKGFEAGGVDGGVAEIAEARGDVGVVVIVGEVLGVGVADHGGASG
jgi:hypothetical protein